MRIIKILRGAVMLPLLFSISEAETKNADVSDELNTCLSSIYDDNGPGATVIVKQGGQIILEKSYGLANVSENIPISSDMVFRIGSLTKQFTAAAIMKLVERNQINLSDPIEVYLPDLIKNGGVITIENLLTHTSGIGDFENLEKTLMETVGQKIDMSDILKFFVDKETQFEAGSKYQYSNPGYILLGAIIEKISGISYQEFLTTEIFDPLEMKNTYFDHEVRLKSKFVNGYHLEDGTVIDAFEFNTDIPYAAGGLLSTIGDIQLWNKGLNSGKVVSTASFNKMTTPFVLSDGGVKEYGYGLEVFEKFGGEFIVHQGGIFGFQSVLANLPHENLEVIILTNTDNPNIWPNEVVGKMIEIIRR